MDMNEINKSLIEMEDYSISDNDKDRKIVSKSLNVSGDDYDKDNSWHSSDSGNEDYISYYEAFYTFIGLSVPSSIGLTLRRVVDISNLIFVGRLDDPIYISGVGLSVLSGHVISISLAIGMSGGVDTLSSQAFGSNNNYLAGGYYRRATVILTCMFIVQSVLLWNIEDFLLFIGQPEDSVSITGIYIKTYLPGIYALCNLELLRRFLSTQSIYHLITLIQFITVILHIFWLYLFIFLLNFGVYGAAIASSITRIATFILAVAYISFFKDIVRKDSWHGFNKDSFTGIWEYLRYGIPSMLMTALEVVCFEGLTIISGYLSSNEQATIIILFDIMAILFMNVIGISITASNLVGNALGAKKPITAKKYASMTVLLSLTIAVIFAIILYYFRYEIASTFTKDDVVKQLVVDTLPVLNIFIVLDFLQGGISGVIRAMGYQKVAVLVGIICYFIIAIPMSVLLAFYFDLRLKGVLLGMPVGLIILGSGFMAIIYCIDWNELSDKIASRIQKEKQNLNIKDKA